MNSEVFSIHHHISEDRVSESDDEDTELTNIRNCHMYKYMAWIVCIRIHLMKRSPESALPIRLHLMRSPCQKYFIETQVLACESIN